MTTHRPRAVINFAAETHVDRSIDNPAAFVDTNTVGVVVLLQQALTHWRDRRDAEDFVFLQVSTDEVFGSISEGAFREHSPFAPNSPYAAAKASADLFVRSFHETFGLPTLVTWCGNNYGPGQFPEKLIPLMISKALGEETMPVYGNGLHVRDWIHVRDHCEGILRTLESGIRGQGYAFGAAVR